MDNTIYIFTLYFKPIAPIRIGGITDGNMLYFINYDGTYIIPYSSWKGSFKRISETLAKTINFTPTINQIINTHINDTHKEDHTKLLNLPEIKTKIDEINIDKIYTQSPIKGKNIRNHLLSLENTKDTFYKEISSIFSPENEYGRDDALKEIVQYLTYKLCPIDGLYGSPYFASKLTFSDTIINGKTYFMTHTTIDRKTRKAKEGNLYTEELKIVDQIKIRIILRQPNRNEKLLWQKTLKYLTQQEITIGAGKTRGIGYLQLDTQQSYYKEINQLSISDKKGINQFLT